jgi:hypothetical protein
MCEVTAAAAEVIHMRLFRSQIYQQLSQYQLVVVAPQLEMELPVYSVQ